MPRRRSSTWGNFDFAIPVLRRSSHSHRERQQGQCSHAPNHERRRGQSFSARTPVACLHYIDENILTVCRCTGIEHRYCRQVDDIRIETASAAFFEYNPEAFVCDQQERLAYTMSTPLHQTPSSDETFRDPERPGYFFTREQISAKYQAVASWWLSDGASHATAALKAEEFLLYYTGRFSYPDGGRFVPVETPGAQSDQYAWNVYNRQWLDQGLHKHCPFGATARGNPRNSSEQPLHYLSNFKDMVCRCRDSAHRHVNRVRNRDTQRMCATFFQSNPGLVTCTKEQWLGTGYQTQDAVQNDFSYGNLQAIARVRFDELLAQGLSLDEAFEKIMGFLHTHAAHHLSPYSASQILLSLRPSAIGGYEEMWETLNDNERHTQQTPVTTHRPGSYPEETDMRVRYQESPRHTVGGPLLDEILSPSDNPWKGTENSTNDGGIIPESPKSFSHSHDRESQQCEDLSSARPSLAALAAHLQFVITSPSQDPWRGSPQSEQSGTAESTIANHQTSPVRVHEARVSRRNQSRISPKPLDGSSPQADSTMAGLGAHLGFMVLSPSHNAWLESPNGSTSSADEDYDHNDSLPMQRDRATTLRPRVDMTRPPPPRPRFGGPSDSPATPTSPAHGLADPFVDPPSSPAAHCNNPFIRPTQPNAPDVYSPDLAHRAWSSTRIPSPPPRRVREVNDYSPVRSCRPRRRRSERTQTRTGSPSAPTPRRNHVDIEGGYRYVVPAGESHSVDRDGDVRITRNRNVREYEEITPSRRRARFRSPIATYRNASEDEDTPNRGYVPSHDWEGRRRGEAGPQAGWRDV